MSFNVLEDMSLLTKCCHKGVTTLNPESPGGELCMVKGSWPDHYSFSVISIGKTQNCEKGRVNVFIHISYDISRYC